MGHRTLLKLVSRNPYSLKTTNQKLLLAPLVKKTFSSPWFEFFCYFRIQKLTDAHMNFIILIKSLNHKMSISLLKFKFTREIANFWIQVTLKKKKKTKTGGKYDQEQSDELQVFQSPARPRGTNYFLMELCQPRVQDMKIWWQSSYLDLYSSSNLCMTWMC